MTSFGPLDPILDEIADRVFARLRGDDWLSQATSGLGRRKHIKAAERLVGEAMARGISTNELGVAIDGDKFLLTRAAIASERARRTAQNASKLRLRKCEKQISDDASNEDEAAACRRVMAEMLAVRGEKK